MKYLNLYENFDFNDDDFDYEEELETYHICQLYQNYDDFYNLYLCKKTNGKRYELSFKYATYTHIYILNNEQIQANMKNNKTVNIYDHYDEEFPNISQKNGGWKTIPISQILKKYNVNEKLSENFEFNEDDFDFEEENDIVFKKGDKLIVTDSKCAVCDKYKFVGDPNGKYLTESKMLRKGCVVEVINTHKNETFGTVLELKKKLKKNHYSGYINGYWYASQCFNKINISNENFDWNEDDFDFEEESYKPNNVYDIIKHLDDGKYYFYIPIINDIEYYEKIYHGFDIKTYFSLIRFQSIKNENITKEKDYFRLIIEKHNSKSYKHIYFTGWVANNENYIEENNFILKGDLR